MMNAEDLLWALDNVDDALVHDARFGEAVKPRSSVRRIVTIVLAAVLLLGMSVTAVGYYGGAEWFIRYFSDFAEQGMTDGQKQFVLDGTIELGQSVTRKGYTVTLDSCLMDSQRAVLRVIVTAPDGVDLKTAHVSFRRWTLFGVYDGAEISVSGAGWMDERYTEQYGQRQVLTLLMDTDLQNLFEYGEISEFRLRLTGLHITSILPPNEDIVVDEVWEFAYSSDVLTEPRELLTGPLDTSVGDNASNMVRLYSVQLSSLGVYIRYSFHDGEVIQPTPVPCVRLVMKDGSEARVERRGGAWNTQSSEIAATYVIRIPIDLSEAAYMEFADGTRIEIQ